MIYFSKLYLNYYKMYYILWILAVVMAVRIITETEENKDFRYYIDEPKKGHRRDIYLSNSAKYVIEKAISLSDQSSEWIFSSKDFKGEWERSYHFDKTIRRICREVNIPERSLHQLRKTFASNLLAQNYPDKFTQKLLGHNDIRTTQKAYNYDIFGTEDKAQAIKDFEVGMIMLTPCQPQS